MTCGLNGALRYIPGRRGDVSKVMTADGADQLPGCRSFTVAKDPAYADAPFITEARESEKAQKALRQLPNVKTLPGRRNPGLSSETVGLSAARR